MTTSWEDLRKRIVKPEDEPEIARIRAEMESQVLAHRLVEARKRQRVTQAQLARTMGISQARISKIERGDINRNEVDTLRAYVMALGGRLEIVADFGGDRMVLG